MPSSSQIALQTLREVAAASGGLAGAERCKLFVAMCPAQLSTQSSVLSGSLPYLAQSQVSCLWVSRHYLAWRHSRGLHQGCLYLWKCILTVFGMSFGVRFSPEPFCLPNRVANRIAVRVRNPLMAFHSPGGCHSNNKD